jgi:uncharacterized protein YciI
VVAAQRRRDITYLGRMTNPSDCTMMVFESDAATVVAFARNDPYVVNGAVRRWRMREFLPWSSKYGTLPDRPSSPR